MRAPYWDCSMDYCFIVCSISFKLGELYWILDLANGGCVSNLQKNGFWTDTDY